MTFTITSPAFPHEGDMPIEFTCDGNDLAPPLVWSGAPTGSQSLALVVDDPDAPDPAAPSHIWVHWVLYNLPPDSAGIAQGAAYLPKGTREGRNDWRRVGYRGPCPPAGRHRYVFHLYALDAVLSDLRHPTKQALFAAMQGHVLGEAVLVGTYMRRTNRGHSSSAGAT